MKTTEKELTRDQLRILECNKKWDIILKEKKMDSCYVCGYNKHFCVIEMHHLVPHKKKYGFNTMYRLLPTKRRIKILDECVALCANCHRLLQNNIISI